MNYHQKHAQGLTRFRRGEPREAARLFAEALVEKETSEGWNDWATAQLANQSIEEAEAGYLRALELDPGNVEPLVNLGAVYVNLGRMAEALPLLRRAEPQLSAEQQEAIRALIRECQEQARPEDDFSYLEAFLGRFAGTEPSAQRLWETRRASYLAALQVLPAAHPGERLLVLGNDYGRLGPALMRIKGYEIVGAGNDERSSTVQACVRDGETGEEYVFPLYRFPLESECWPLEESSFDAVWCSEVLERAHRDPMLVLQQINRLLKPGGLLLLATPNIASARSVTRVLRGDNPYLVGQYRRPRQASGGHNREYAPAELERVVAAAGFASLRLQTRSRLGDEEGVLRQLLGFGMPIARRGDEILLLARKESEVRERFPEELYAAGDDDAEAVERSLNDEALVPGPQPILVVHERLPEMGNDTPDSWLLEILRTLRTLGHEVTYLATGEVSPGTCPPVLENLGIEVLVGDEVRGYALFAEEGAGGENSGGMRPVWRFTELLQARHFQNALLVQDANSGLSIPERFHNAIRKESPGTRIAVLAGRRRSREEFRLAEASGLLTDQERALGVQQRELESYRLADLVLTAGEAEQRALLQLDASLRVALLSRVVRPGPGGPGWSERAGLLLSTNGEPHAVRDALQWFFAETWPRLRRAIPGVKLHLAGDLVPSPPSGAEDVTFVGRWPSSAEALFPYRLLVSPMRLSSGFRSESLMALAHGLPLATTTVGAEGLQLRDGMEALVGDSAAALAAAVARAYLDEALWTDLATRGLTHAGREFSPARLQSYLETALARLRSLPSAPREPDYAWSVRKVEAFRPGLPSVCGRDTAPAMVLRMHAYADYAELLLDQGRPEEACEQLRHIFAFARPPLPPEHFFANILILLERCYRARGDHERGARCGREALQFIPELSGKLAAAPAGRASHTPAPGQRSAVPAPVVHQEP